MGKGDIRTRRGKLFRGTFGNSRPKHKKSATPARAQAPTPAKPAREPAPKRRS